MCGNGKATMQLRAVLFCASLIILSNVAVAQKPTVVNVPAPLTPANSGKKMFEAYCAACHGKGGKGDGPAATALKVPPPDLTGLTERNDGKFPSSQVAMTIAGQAGTPAHGSKEMPIWGPVFMSMNHQHESEVRLRVANLTDYIKSFQRK